MSFKGKMVRSVSDYKKTPELEHVISTDDVLIQIAAIINRVARVLGINTDGYTHSFTDVVGHWVDTELGWPSSVGIINGVGNNQFSPDTELTTEQAIAVTYRALQVLKQ